MKGLTCVLVASVMAVSCAQTPPEPEGPEYHAYADLARMMQAIPFPASNIIFDAGIEDPEVALKKAEAESGGAPSYAAVYGGWTEVENAALALQETANLLKVPGRLCRNGKPVPNDQEDFKMFTDRLADAGMAAYRAAQAKDVDALGVDVGGAVSDACAACHEVYRDFDDESMRCIVREAAAE